MAKPIREIERTTPTPEQVQTQALTDLIQAISTNRDAIMDTMEILGHLHSMGALTAIKGLLDQRHEVGAIAVQQFNQPKMHHMMKNAMTAVQALSSIDPGSLARMVNGLSHGLEASKDVHANGDSPSLWDLAKYMRDPAVRTSMATMLGLLHGMGESLKNDSSHVH
jgi:uncharacterized protein YjgD (DUF1641 family)